jgi:proline iminopeptidase
MNTDLNERGLLREFSGVNRHDILSGGVQMIPVETPKGTFRVWTKRIGNHPTIKVLLLHGGPGLTHEYLEAFDSYFPQVGFEYYYYDQLGSYYSDRPDEPDLWELPRFVEEVEQVRQFLGLDRDNFYLYGHSWGGILAIEYALKYQQHLKGLIISNMMASIPAYNEYAQQVLMPAIAPEVVAEIEQIEAQADYDNPRYMELLIPHHYVHHVLRMQPEQWTEPLNRAFKQPQSRHLCTATGAERTGCQGKALKLGSDCRLSQDCCTDTGDRQPTRHDEPCTSGMDGKNG